LRQEFQAHDIAALQIDIGDEVIGSDAEFLLVPLGRFGRRYGLAWFLLGAGVAWVGTLGLGTVAWPRLCCAL